MLLILIGILVLGLAWLTGNGAAVRGDGATPLANGTAPGIGAPAQVRAPRPGPRPPTDPSPAPAAPVAPVADSTTGSTGTTRAPTADAALATGDSHGDPTRFSGRGRLRGSIDPARGAEMPAAWTLVVRPNPMLPGHQHAARRELELGAGDREFVVEDLPLGGYEVTARAAGRNSRAVPVLLDRTHRDAYVTLQLTPAGFLEGLVREEGGAPLDGLLVRLEATAEGTSRETRTDANGAFLFEDVLDGPHRLHFGSAEPAALPSRTLEFSAPSMRFPTLTAPRLARLELVVAAEGGGPVPGAAAYVEGPTGLVTLATDANGRAAAQLLKPGQHRLTVQAEGFSPSVEELSFEGDERVERRVELRRL